MSANLGQSNPSSWAAYVSEQDIVRLAQSLRRINTDLMKASSASAGQRVWYQGGEPYFDIVFELPVSQQDCSGSPDSALAANPESSLPNWCQFTLRGKVLLWTRQPFRLHTGETEELDVPPMLAYYAASKTIRDSAQLDAAFVGLVQRICQARPDQALLAQMGQILESCKG